MKLGDADFLNVMDFEKGANTDDAERIQCALDAARISGIGAVYLPRRTYVLNSGLSIKLAGGDLTRSVRMFSDFAVLKAGSGVPPGASMLHLKAAGAPIILENLVLDAGGAFEYAIHAQSCNSRQTLLQGVSVGFARRDGMFLEGCQAAAFRSCSSEYNGRNGWTLDGCTALSLVGCRARRNRAHGFENFGRTVFSGANFLLHVESEGNAGCGVWAWDGVFEADKKDQHSSGLRIRDSVISENGSHGIQIGAWDMSVSGVTFRPGNEACARWAWIESTATGVVIRDCTIGRKLTAPQFHVAHDASGRTRHVTFEGNYATLPESIVYGHDLASADPSRAASVIPEAAT